MKTSFNRGKKIGMKMPISPPVSNAHFKHRKIPQKPRGFRRDEERICGKERRRDAANSELLEEEQ